MKIEVVEKSANELKIKIEGEGHTFCNVLQGTILKDATVDMAGYSIAHPLISNPIIYVRTKGRKKPEIVLKNTAKEIKRQNKSVFNCFEKALREWEKNNTGSVSEVSP